MQKEDAIAILEKIYNACSDIFPCKIHDAYLYGSYARGDFDRYSDVDILLTVPLTWEEIEPYRSAVSHVSSNLSLEHDVTVSVSVNPLELFTRYADVLPYYQNVLREGIRHAA